MIAAALVVVTASAPAYAEPKRPQQDYGAPKEDSERLEEAVMWVPRVILFPLWLVSEFLVRRPIGALVKVAEREQWPQEVMDFFTFGERRQVTVYPSALFDFGLLPSVGFNAQWKYFLAEPNRARLHFGTWGPEWIAARFTDTYALTEHDDISFDVNYQRRKDNRFYGMGSRSPDNTLSRYRIERAEASAVYERRGWRESTLQVQTGVRHLAIRDGTCCGDPSLADNVARGVFPAPPGFDTDYTGGFNRVSLAFDSRKPRPEQGSGIRVELNGEGVFAPGRATHRAWLKYGAEAGVFLDVTGTQRIVSLSAAAELADPLLGTIPFLEQATLGGDKPMRGYLRDRLIDRSSFVARMHYTWPIWVYLDGVIEVDAGNVFGERFAGIDPKLFRLSTGIGVRSNGERNSGFELLLAGATDPLDEGFRVSAFRLLLGSHHGF
jgi:hypothetical protein